MAWDYRFKYTFTGDSGVGKTTSIYSFLKKDTNNVASTIGVEYIMKTLKVGGNNIMLHIWDTVLASPGRARSIPLHRPGLL